MSMTLVESMGEHFNPLQHADALLAGLSDASRNPESRGKYLVGRVYTDKVEIVYCPTIEQAVQLRNKLPLRERQEGIQPLYSMAGNETMIRGQLFDVSKN